LKWALPSKTVPTAPNGTNSSEAVRFLPSVTIG
jgi:hypothetical protein